MEEGPIPVQSCTGFRRAALQVDIRVSPHGALQNKAKLNIFNMISES